MVLHFYGPPPFGQGLSVYGNVTAYLLIIITYAAITSRCSVFTSVSNFFSFMLICFYMNSTTRERWVSEFFDGYETIKKLLLLYWNFDDCIFRLKILTSYLKPFECRTDNKLNKYVLGSSNRLIHLLLFTSVQVLKTSTYGTIYPHWGDPCR